MSGTNINEKKRNLLKMRIWEVVLYTVVIILIIVLVIFIAGIK